MSIWAKLFPRKNRQAAAVAWIRTFWQSVRGASFLGGGGAIVIDAAHLHNLDLVTLAWGAGATLTVAVLTASLSAGNILVHGLPGAYTDATAPTESIKDAVARVATDASPVPAPVEPLVPQTADQIIAGPGDTDATAHTASTAPTI